MSKIKNILDELDEYIPEKDRHLVVESRANHVIGSAINVLKMIDENFKGEEAKDLKRRFLLAIQNANPKKFEQGMKNLKERKDEK